MNDVRQRNVALTWVVPVSIVLLVVVSALVVPLVPGRYSLGRLVVLLPFLAFFLFVGVQPLLWWWGADLRVGASGIGFGTERPRTTPAQVTFMARNPWVVPWEAISGVRVVRSSSAVRAMRKAARPGGASQPTYWGGYFPAGGRAALVIDVDATRVWVPEIRPPSSRRRVPGSVPGVGVDTSPVWVFPVRDVGAVLDAIREHGLTPAETDQPVLPHRSSPVTGADDPRLVDMWAEEMGRQPTPEELDQLREQWRRSPGPS